MPDYGNIVITSAAEFEAIVQDTNRSLILVLHDDADSSEAFEIASGMTENPGFHCTTVWCKDVQHARPTVERLTGHEIINWDPLGTRVASINVHDHVTLALSRVQSTDPIAILGAFWFAVGG